MIEYCDECYPVALKVWGKMKGLIFLSFVAGAFFATMILIIMVLLVQ